MKSSNMSQAQTIVIFGILLSCVPTEIFTAVVPKYLKVCHRSDPQLNKCIKNCIEDLRSRMPGGIPNLHIPPLEPLLVPEVKIDQNSGAVYLHSTFRDIVVGGLSHFEIQEINANVKNNTLTMRLNFPSVNLKANYTLKGKILMMPLLGDGVCAVNLTDIGVVAKVYGSRYSKNKQEHLLIDDVSLAYTIGDLKVQLDNLFNGDAALGEKMNLFLNDNWRVVAEEIKPIMESAMAEVLQHTTKKLFEIYTFDQLLPK